MGKKEGEKSPSENLQNFKSYLQKKGQHTRNKAKSKNSNDFKILKR
jgi:hypothetical protein